MKRPSIGALVWEHPRADCNLKGAIAMFVAILTIFLGALGAAASVQELVVQGVFNNQKIPLTGGTLGAVSSGLLAFAGIALLRQSPGAISLTRAAAVASLPVSVLIGKIVWGLAGWPMTIVGLGWPLFLLMHFRKSPTRASDRQAEQGLQGRTRR